MTAFYKYETLHVNKQQTKTNVHKPTHTTYTHYD